MDLYWKAFKRIVYILNNHHTREILMIRWSRYTFDGSNSECYVGNTTINWKGQIIKISIRSFWGNGPGGLRTHYEFSANGIDYSFKMIDSYVKGTSGSVPKIEFENLKLVISARPTFLEIIEKEILGRSLIIKVFTF